jgi:thioredoxin reductase (NADPH)
VDRDEATDIELAVIGAGPCGLGVGIAAREAGVECILFDRECVASSIARYPTWMTFFSTAERLELGGIPFIASGDKPTRRDALRYYQRLARHFRLRVRSYETVTAARPAREGFRLDTRRLDGRTRSVTARSVVVATGYFDHPNRLGVPGEDLPTVHYGYREGHVYFDQDVIVVGGGNSAVDAALELWRWGARVTLVHFEAGLDRGVKPWILPDITNRIGDGSIAARFGHRVREVRPGAVLLHDRAGDRTETLPADFVLAMTGYTPDPWLLQALGAGIDPRSGIPVHDPATMETNVPGVFIAGVIAAGNDANKVFIENGRDHGPRIVATLAARRRTSH